MFVVRALQKKEDAAEIFGLFHTVLKDDELVYCAFDLYEDEVTVKSVLGACSFCIAGGRNTITHILFPDDGYDEEAIIILVRTVMNFMYRCEIGSVTLEKDACPDDSLARRIGFIKEKGDRIDLVEFYKSPCAYLMQNEE